MVLAASRQQAKGPVRASVIGCGLCVRASTHLGWGCQPGGRSTCRTWLSGVHTALCNGVQQKLSLGCKRPWPRSPVTRACALRHVGKNAFAIGLSFGHEQLHGLGHRRSKSPITRCVQCSGRRHSLFKMARGLAELPCPSWRPLVMPLHPQVSQYYTARIYPAASAMTHVRAGDSRACYDYQSRKAPPSQSVSQSVSIHQTNNTSRGALHGTWSCRRC